jgi:hypothetical protein
MIEILTSIATPQLKYIWLGSNQAISLQTGGRLTLYKYLPVIIEKTLTFDYSVPLFYEEIVLEEKSIKYPNINYLEQFDPQENNAEDTEIKKIEDRIKRGYECLSQQEEEITRLANEVKRLYYSTRGLCSES